MKKKSNTPEQRFLPVKNIEMRVSQEEDSKERYVSGVGIVYDEEVEIWEGFFEKISRGAFDESLKSGNEIKSFFNHKTDFVLSTTESTPALELNNTDTGLEFTSPIPPTSYGDDLAVNLERGNVRGASFSFTVEEDTWFEDKDGVYHRDIVKASIYEVGPVTNPAYEQTQVALRDRGTLEQEMKTRCKKEESKSNVSFYRAKLTILEGAQS